MLFGKVCQGVGGFDGVLPEAIPSRGHVKKSACFFADQPGSFKHLGVWVAEHLEAIDAAFERHADVFHVFLYDGGGLGIERPGVVVSLPVGVKVAVRDLGHEMAPENDRLGGPRCTEGQDQSEGDEEILKAHVEVIPGFAIGEGNGKFPCIGPPREPTTRR